MQPTCAGAKSGNEGLRKRSPNQEKLRSGAGNQLQPTYAYSYYGFKIAALFSMSTEVRNLDLAHLEGVEPSAHGFRDRLLYH